MKLLGSVLIRLIVCLGSSPQPPPDPRPNLRRSAVKGHFCVVLVFVHRGILFLGIYGLESILFVRWVKSTLKNKKTERRKEGEEKGSNIPKRCLESSPGVVTAQDASLKHKSRVWNHNHTSYQHRPKWDTTVGTKKNIAERTPFLSRTRRDRLCDVGLMVGWRDVELTAGDDSPAFDNVDCVRGVFQNNDCSAVLTFYNKGLNFQFCTIHDSARPGKNRTVLNRCLLNFTLHDSVRTGKKPDGFKSESVDFYTAPFRPDEKKAIGKIENNTSVLLKEYQHFRHGYHVATVALDGYNTATMWLQWHWTVTTRLPCGYSGTGRLQHGYHVATVALDGYNTVTMWLQWHWTVTTRLPCGYSVTGRLQHGYHVATVALDGYNTATMWLQWHWTVTTRLPCGYSGTGRLQHGYHVATVALDGYNTATMWLQWHWTVTTRLPCGYSGTGRLQHGYHVATVALDGYNTATMWLQWHWTVTTRLPCGYSGTGRLQHGYHVATVALDGYNTATMWLQWHWTVTTRLPCGYSGTGRLQHGYNSVQCETSPALQQQLRNIREKTGRPEP
ncbi:hypothetical protein J6590_059092 [Homalodisca vitripennis]|nr:hypothetical protein J6590_059092 [Homalodisca vitripennis]